jgi:hypothetical protein
MSIKPISAHLKAIALVICLALTLFASGIQAQTTSLTYGSAADGSIPSAGDATTFRFSGAAGDLIFARVINVTSTLNTVLSLAAADGSESISVSNGSLTHRLASSGAYQLVVTGQNGTTGDFVLRLDARTDIRLPLPLGQVTSAQFSLDGPPQIYNFAQNPSGKLLLTVSAADPAFRFSTEVRDSLGQVIAYFNPQMRSTVLTLAQGSGGYDVTITASDPAATGIVLLDLESASGASTPVPPTPAAAPSGTTPAATQVSPPAATPVPSVPLPSNGSVYCQVSTNGSANIHSAPDANAPTVERLTRSRAVEVIGLSADGAWFAVRLATQVGWIAKAVARQIEPCTNVPLFKP